MTDATQASDPFIEHSLRTSMFFPQSRLMVAGNPKAAGTSLRWWLLPAHGVDVQTRTATSLWGESAPFQTVWDNVDLTYTWPSLSTRDQTDALYATDVLTVQPVRNPVTRAFSAWSSKYLNLEPYYFQRLPSGFAAPPDAIESATHITELFTRFMTSLQNFVAAEDWTSLDVHFWPQHRLLARGPTSPALLLRIEAMGEGLAAITDHLRHQGMDVEPPPRINENVVAYQQHLVSDRALEAIRALYQDDFTTFGYSPDAPSSRPNDLSLAWLNDVRGRNRRYAVIHQKAVSARGKEAELERKLREARKRHHELITSSSWRLTKPVRWLSRLAARARRRLIS